MSKITTYNYEAYLLDSMEGNLSAELTAELLLFFENHPKLKEDDFEVLELSPLPTTFENKEDLKKDIINDKLTENLLIAEAEGLNTIQESNSLALLIKEDAQLQKELMLYQKTKLIAPQVIFEGKESLKREERKIIPLYWWGGSVAAVLLTLFILKGLSKQEQELPHQLANKNSIEAVQDSKITEENIVEPIIKQTQEEEKTEKIISKKKFKQKPIKTVLLAEKIDSVIKNEDIIKEENPVAEDETKKDYENVRITFVDDPLPVLASNNSSQPKTSKKKKKGVFKKIFNSQVRDKVRAKMMRKEVNERGEVVAYALAVGGVNLYRKELK